MRLHRSALLAGLAIFITALLASSAQAQTIVRCRTTGGSLVDCTTPLLNTYINWGSPSAIGGTAPAAVTGTIVTATTQFSGPATGLTGIPAAQVTGSLSGVTINCSSNTCQNIANASLLSGIDAIKIGSGLVSNSEFGYLQGVSSPIQTQIDGLGLLVNLLVNNGYTLFLHRTASDISTYESLKSEPANYTEKIDSVSVTSGTSPQLLGSYATDPGVPGISTLPSGMWGFREFASVNNTSGSSTIFVEVYKRNTGGTETLLFSTTSPTITTTSAYLYYWIYTQSADIAIDPTDRLVIKFYGQTTSVSSRTISHYYEGTTHASWLSTPMPAPIPVSGAQAQIVATPPTQTGPVALRSLTSDYLPASVVTISASQILTNKILNCANNTCTVRLGSDVTGTLPEANGGFASDISGIGTGLVARTAANTYAARTLTAPAAGITVSNGGGGSGNPTLALANDLAAVEGLSTNGCAARTATDTWTTRTVTAGTGISVTNGDCTAGNPTIAVDTGTVVTLTGTQTLTNKTLTSPVLGSTVTGTYTLGGSPSLGTNLTGGLNKITGLAAGTTTGDSVRWEQAGVAGPTFYLNTSQSFVANGYVGLGGDGSSTVNVNIVPWVAPVACTLRNLRVFGLANTSGSVVFTIYKSSSAVSPTYASTTLTCTLTNTFACSDTSHSVSLSAGDLVVGFTGSSWAANGASITTQCVPN